MKKFSLYFILIPIFSFIGIHAQELTLNLQSEKSNISIIADSIEIKDITTGSKRVFYNSNDINFDTETNVKNIEQSRYDNNFTVEVFTLEGQKVLKKIVNRISSYSINEIINSLKTSPYILRITNTNSEILFSKPIFKIDSFKPYFIDSPVHLSSDNMYSIKIYKLGYKTRTISDFIPRDYMNEAILLSPQFDKFVSSIIFKMGGISKSGRTNHVWKSESGTTNNDYKDIKDIFIDSIKLEHTEIRRLENNCLKEVMLQKYQPLECVDNVSISPDTINMCNLKCNLESYKSVFNGGEVEVFFDRSNKQITKFALNYTDGSVIGTQESFGHKQEYKEVSLLFYDLSYIEYDDKYVVILNNPNELKNKMRKFFWNSYLHVTSFQPPYTYDTFTNDYFGDIEVNNSSEVVIELIK